MATPVSGPGQFSQRTDKAVGQANRSLPNADYGEQAQYQEQLQGAPLAQSPSFSDMFGDAASRVTPMGAESALPDVPVTDGAAEGPGAGVEAISGSDTTGQVDTLKSYYPALEFMADNSNSDMARNLVRQISAMTM